MWLAQAVPFAKLPASPRRTAFAEASESAVAADALPAQSKAAVGMREPGVFWSAAGSGSATPLWLSLRKQVNWKRVAEGSESAVAADALPAQSKAAAGMREPGGVVECGGKRERHAALAFVEEAGTWCGVFAERSAIG